MIWILITLIATVSWGFTDLFSKMSVDYNDKDFYIKLTIWTGLATGVLLILILPFSESKMPVVELAAKYMLFIPTTLLYILSIILGFVGLKYLELSVFSPIQNASGGMAMLMILAYYLYSGTISDAAEAVSPMDWLGVILITAVILPDGCSRHGNRQLCAERHRGYGRNRSHRLPDSLQFCVFCSCRRTLAVPSYCEKKAL